MGKKNNSATKSAAEQAATQQKAPTTEAKSKSTNVNVIQLSDLERLTKLNNSGAMDHNHVMDMIRVQHETFRMDPKAAEHTGMSQEAIDKINKINAIEQVALMASVATFDQTPFALTMRTAQRDAIIEVAASLGITIDQKALPTPTEDGQATLPSNAIQIPEEVKTEIKAEKQAVSEKAELDPTKIENEEALKKSLLHILVKGNGSDNLYDKIGTAINFYEAYLGIQAGKAEDPEAARKELKSKTRVDFLSSIANLLGKCTFTIGGIAKFMYEQTERTKSPVVAFCQFRDASLNKKTGMPQIEDQMVADIVKVLIRWYADTEIITTKEIIAGFERDIEHLKKDEKKNAKGIETGLKKIESCKKHIDDVEAVVTYVNVPSRETVDNFAADYTNNQAEGYKIARMTGAKIMKTYYGSTETKGIKVDSLVHNLQQYMGVITNMFLPPLSCITDYSEANITELEREEVVEEKKN